MQTPSIFETKTFFSIRLNITVLNNQVILLIHKAYSIQCQEFKQL